MMDNYFFYKTHKRRFGDLFFCFCGYEACEPLHSFGPAVRPTYLIHFVLSGKGTFYTYSDDRTYHITEGEGFLIEPGKQTFYQADEKEPWRYLWVGFNGDLAADFISGMGLGNEALIFRSPHGEAFQEIVFEMLRYNMATDRDELILESLLCRFLAILSEDVMVKTPEARKGNEYVRKAIEFIQNNYSKKIRVQDVADHVNINRGYLYALFKQELQMSPQEYINNLRLTRAAEQINTTNYPIEMIGLLNGYGDPAVFTKAFKRKHGVSPSAYRQKTVDRSKASLQEKNRKGTKTDENA